VEERAADILQGRFALHPAKVDRAAFARARLRDDAGKPAPSFPGLEPDPDLDLYILFVKIRAEVPPSVASITGLGVYNKSVIGRMTKAAANYALVVLDARQMKPLLALRAVPSPSRPDNMPIATLEDKAWPSAPPQLTPEQTGHIRAVLADLVSDSEEEVLLRSGLTGKVITDEAPSVDANGAQ
jgi:hypothetical protein